MVSRVILSIIVGVVTWLLTMLVGMVLVQATLDDLGRFVTSVSPIVGLVAGVWYFFAGSDRGRVV